MEGVVEGYSLPGRHEVDPSAVMAFFYYVLFGMMLSDAAYGILTVVGSAFALKKFPDMELKMRKTLRMFLFCGISTTVWGEMCIRDRNKIAVSTSYIRNTPTGGDTVPRLFFCFLETADRFSTGLSTLLPQR